MKYFDFHYENFMACVIKRKLLNQPILAGCDETVLFLLLLPALWPSA